MTNSKAGKLLAKALHNSSKEEAVTAFGMAFTQAQREKISLASLHRIEVVSDNGREKELVDKYNKVLTKAKALRTELAQTQDANRKLNARNEEWRESVSRLTKERDELLKEVQALRGTVRTKTADKDAQPSLDQHKKITLLEQENDYLRNVLENRAIAHRKELLSARDALATLNASYTLTPVQIEQLKVERDRAITRCNELAGIVASLRDNAQK